MQPALILTKFIATHSTLSRRAAEQAIIDKRVCLNGKIIKKPGMVVQEGDEVQLDGKTLTASAVAKFYVLMNKPEGVVTSTKDQDGRPTVINLLPHRLKNQVVPVGRLDLLTRGVLLLTNDGDLNYYLAHPRYGVQKTYLATLDRPATAADLSTIYHGFHLTDGFVKADRVVFATKNPGKRVIISLHSGKNRIVRRLFKHLGYNVTTLERVGFAGLSSKGMTAGTWRLLSKYEVARLKALCEPKEQAEANR